MINTVSIISDTNSPREHAPGGTCMFPGGIGVYIIFYFERRYSIWWMILIKRIPFSFSRFSLLFFFASCAVRTRGLSLTKGTLLPTELRRPRDCSWCLKRKECLPSCDARSVSVATRIRTGVATATTWSTNHYTMATCLKIVIVVASGEETTRNERKKVFFFEFFHLNFSSGVE